MAIIDLIGNIVGIGTGVAKIAQAFDSPKVPGLKFSQRVAKAAIDPNDPKTQNLAAVFKERLMADVLQGINDQERAYRRLRARGVVPGGIIPERRDEARTMTIAAARANAGNVALQQAMQTLLGGAGAVSPGFGPGLLANVNRAQNVTTGIDLGGDILQRLFGQSSQPQLQSSSLTLNNIFRDIFRKASLSPETADFWSGQAGVTER